MLRWAGRNSQRRFALSGETERFYCTSTSQKVYVKSDFAPQRRSILGAVIRTPDDLNLRLSTCLYHRKPAVAVNIFEKARKERLPWNDQSIEYTVYNLVLNGQYRRAEQLLETYRTEERVHASEESYIHIMVGYAKEGDFKNIQNLLTIMRRGHVPITERLHRYIFHYAERYYLNQDVDDPEIRPKLLLEKFPASSAAPYYTRTPSFDDFVAGVPDSNENQENETNDQSSEPQTTLFGKGSESESKKPVKKRNSFIIDEEDLEAMDKGSEDSDENYLPRSGTISFDAASIDNTTVNALNTIFVSTADFEDEKILVKKISGPEEEVDITSIQNHPIPHYEPFVLDLKDDRRTNFYETERKCTLTGNVLKKEGADENDREFPFHDNYEDPHSSKHKYQDPSKDPISEQFSVEDRIENGEGVILHIDEHFEYSLYYHRAKLARRSVLSMMTGEGFTASPAAYAALVDGYGRGGNVNALDLAVCEMERLGIRSDHLVVNRTLSAYARNVVLDQMEISLKWARKHEVPLRFSTLNSLLHAYVRSHQFQRALEIRDEMNELGYSGNFDAIEEALTVRNEQGISPPTSQAYDAIISGAAHAKRYDKVNDYFLQMVQESLNPTENILDIAFNSFYKTRDLHNATRCLWMLREFGFEVLTPKRVENIIDLLCQEKLYSQATKLLSRHQSLPFLLRPRNFTYLLQGLLKTESHAVINTLEKKMRWPAYIALAMIYAPQAAKEGKSTLEKLAQDNHKITELVVEGVAYYYMKKNQVDAVMNVYHQVGESYPHIIRTPKLFAFCFYSLIRNERIKDFFVLLKEMTTAGITLTDFVDVARASLSPMNFQFIWDGFFRETKIDLHEHASKDDDKPNLLDYMN